MTKAEEKALREECGRAHGDAAIMKLRAAKWESIAYVCAALAFSAVGLLIAGL